MLHISTQFFGLQCTGFASGEVGRYIPPSYFLYESENWMQEIDLAPP